MAGFHVVSGRPPPLPPPSEPSAPTSGIVNLNATAARSAPASASATSPASFATRAITSPTTATTSAQHQQHRPTAPAATYVPPSASTLSGLPSPAAPPPTTTAVRRTRESWTSQAEVEDALNDDDGEEYDYDSFEREEAERARKRPRLDFNDDHIDQGRQPLFSSSSHSHSISNYHHHHYNNYYGTHNNANPALVGSSSSAPHERQQPRAFGVVGADGIGGSTVHLASSSSSSGPIITGLEEEISSSVSQHHPHSPSGPPPHFLPPYLATATPDARPPPSHPRPFGAIMQHHSTESTNTAGGGGGPVLVDGLVVVHDAPTPSSTLSSSSSPSGLPSALQSGAAPTQQHQHPFMPTPSPLSANGFTAPTPRSPQATANGLSKGKETNGFLANGGNNAATPPVKAVVPRVYLPGTTIYQDSNIDREEFVRLAIQIFKDIGYNETASTLEAESGYSLETPLVTEFRQAVLQGDWTKVSDMLPSLGVGARDLGSARYLVSQQHYLELLEQRATSRALNVLRTDLAPNSVDSDRLHVLSSLMMCADPNDLRERAKWDGVDGSSRSKLLDELQNYIPTHAMLPQRRLATLLEQSKSYQKSLCMYHDPRAKFSLYTDHECSRAAFPNVTTNILEHDDQVWNLAWSRDGKYLASACKDRKATVWYIGPVEEGIGGRECRAVHVLRDHKFPVQVLEWSVDGKTLITGADQSLTMWDVESGNAVMEMKGHTENVSAIVALPDGSGYVCGGMDKKITFWDHKGVLVDEWTSPAMRVLDLAVTPDGTKLIVAAVVHAGGLWEPSVEQGFRPRDKSPPKPPSSRSSLHNGLSHRGSSSGLGGGASTASSMTGSSQLMMFDEDSGLPMRRRIIVYDLQTKEEEFKLSMPKEITSLSISSDSRYALINHAPDDLLLYDLVKRRTVRKFTGQQQREDVIRSCFGGVDEDFILSGSEDSSVYIWRKETGTLVEVLSGHGKGNVNAVAWNPKEVGMFASCSDDHTIRIWEAPPAGIALAEDLSSPSMSNGDYDGRAFSPPPPSKSQSPARYSHPYRSDSFDAGSGPTGSVGAGTLWPRNVR